MDMFPLLCVSPRGNPSGSYHNLGLIIQLIISEHRVMFEVFSLLNGLAFKEFLFSHAGS